jgi:hypothetical protein
MYTRYFIIKAGIEQWEVARDIGEQLSEQNHRWCISFTTEDNELTIKIVEQEEFNEFNNLNNKK